MRRFCFILFPCFLLSCVATPDQAFSSPTETRILKCQTVEPSVSDQSFLPAGIDKTSVLFSDQGPGNVESIQLALYLSGDAATYYDSLIDIKVDGQLIVSVPVGLLFNYYDIDGKSTVTYLSKNISLTYYTAGADIGGRIYSMGAFRRMFIPYQNSCTITLRNQGKGSPDIYSQILYRDGGSPDPEIYGTNRIKFHAYCIPFASGTPSKAYDTITAIPLTQGKGELDSVQYYAARGSNLTFLEGNPSIILDGHPLTYGGTEDFFGLQNYGAGIPSNGTAKCQEEWGMPSVVNSGAHQASAYRFFGHECPFNSSLSLTFKNGQDKESHDVDGVQYATFAIWYTKN